MALTHLKALTPKPSILRKLAGVPWSEKSQVIMWVVSGMAEKKSKKRFGSWTFVTGEGLSEWTRSGNLMASRMKKTGMSLPTRS